VFRASGNLGVFDHLIYPEVVKYFVLKWWRQCGCLLDMQVICRNFQVLRVLGPL
jgi:hypothetical protein